QRRTAANTRIHNCNKSLLLLESFFGSQLVTLHQKFSPRLQLRLHFGQPHSATPVLERNAQKLMAKDHTLPFQQVSGREVHGIPRSVVWSVWAGRGNRRCRRFPLLRHFQAPALRDLPWSRSRWRYLEGFELRQLCLAQLSTLEGSNLRRRKVREL